MTDEGWEMGIGDGVEEALPARPVPDNLTMQFVDSLVLTTVDGGRSLRAALFIYVRILLPKKHGASHRGLREKFRPSCVLHSCIIRDICSVENLLPS